MDWAGEAGSTKWARGFCSHDYTFPFNWQNVCVGVHIRK